MCEVPFMESKNQSFHSGALVRISSLHKHEPAKRRNKELLVFSLIYWLSAVAIIVTVGGMDIFSYVGGWIIVFVLTMYGLLFLVLLAVKSKGGDFIITENGVAFSNFVYSRFNEIESYQWKRHAYFGATLFSIARGTTLYIYTYEKTFSRWIANNGLSILVIQLIFFTPEQIEQVDQIFKEKGVKKFESLRN